MPASSSQNADRMIPAWGLLNVAWIVHAATPGVLASRLTDGAGDTSVSAPLVLISIQVERKGERDSLVQSKEESQTIVRAVEPRRASMCTNQVVCRLLCLSIHG
jgi:hypothetical protein